MAINSAVGAVAFSLAMPNQLPLSFSAQPGAWLPLAYLVIAAELLGGIALILGVATRWVVLAMAHRCAWRALASDPGLH